MTDQHTGTLINDLVASAANIVQKHRPTPAQWQSAKQRPTQFGDNKNRPQTKVRQYEPEGEDDMERDRR